MLCSHRTRLSNPIQINNAELRFKPGLVDLTRFDAQTGKSDINATGHITNLLGFLLSDKNLRGQFNLTSNTFAVADFIGEDKSAKMKQFGKCDP